MSLQLIFVLFLSITLQSCLGVQVICYYDDSVTNSFTPEDIDLDICTQLHFASMAVYENATIAFVSSDDTLKQLAALKTKNPNINVIVNIGGSRAYAAAFSAIAANATKTTNFVNNVIDVIHEYNLDGVDIDWEYPEQSGGIPEDQVNMITMLTAMREGFQGNGSDFLIITPVYKIPANVGYHVNALSKVVDYLNVMSTDFFSYTSNKTGHSCPLFPSKNEDDFDAANRNIENSINNWLTLGADPAKLIISVGFYGRTYQLEDPENNGVFAPIVGVGNDDYLGYDELCQLTDGWTNVWDELAMVPYKFKGDQWISYDDPISIGLKSLYIVERNLGGIMVWTVNTDDLEGKCGVKNALINAVKDNFA